MVANIIIVLNCYDLCMTCLFDSCTTCVTCRPTKACACHHHKHTLTVAVSSVTEKLTFDRCIPCSVS